MAQCEVCGNDYAQAFQVVMAKGDRHTFDSFECAANALAPRCKICGVRIMGHGMESNGSTYCCASCARKDGVQALRDHA